MEVTLFPPGSQQIPEEAAERIKAEQNLMVFRSDNKHLGSTANK